MAAKDPQNGRNGPSKGQEDEGNKDSASKPADLAGNGGSGGGYAIEKPLTRSELHDSARLLLRRPLAIPEATFSALPDKVFAQFKASKTPRAVIATAKCMLAMLEHNRRLAVDQEGQTVNVNVQGNVQETVIHARIEQFASFLTNISPHKDLGQSGGETIDGGGGGEGTPPPQKITPQFPLLKQDPST